MYFLLFRSFVTLTLVIVHVNTLVFCKVPELIKIVCAAAEQPDLLARLGVDWIARMLVLIYRECSEQQRQPALDQLKSIKMLPLQASGQTMFAAANAGVYRRSEDFISRYKKDKEVQMAIDELAILDEVVFENVDALSRPTLEYMIEKLGCRRECLPISSIIAT